MFSYWGFHINVTIFCISYRKENDVSTHQSYSDLHPKKKKKKKKNCTNQVM